MKYKVYRKYVAWAEIGEYEAESFDDAISVAVGDGEESIPLCWECDKMLQDGLKAVDDYDADMVRSEN